MVTAIQKTTTNTDAPVDVRQRADSRLTVVLGQMLTIKSYEDRNSPDAIIDDEIRKLDEMMAAWWPGILEHVGLEEIERELAWLTPAD